MDWTGEIRAIKLMQMPKFPVQRVTTEKYSLITFVKDFGGYLSFIFSATYLISSQFLYKEVIKHVAEDVANAENLEKENHDEELSKAFK